MNAFERIIELLGGWIHSHFDSDDKIKNIAMFETIKIVRKVAEEHNNGWIPLSSGKRPKDNQFILFTVKLERGDNLETFYNTKYGFYEEYADRFVISDGSVNTMPFGEVTAWQPLPESYREEVKEDE